MSNSNPDRMRSTIERAIPADRSGCWLWPGNKITAGYGTIRAGAGRLRERLYVHRISYELFVGPIPEGMQIDHTCHSRDQSCRGGKTCRHRPCFNPAHLEPVTNRVNFVRGAHPGAISHRTNICQKGLHELAGENVMRQSGGTRRCRQCYREWVRLRELARRARS